MAAMDNLGRQFLNDRQVASYKNRARELMGQSREHRLAGRQNAADRTMRHAVTVREQAQNRSVSGGKHTAWGFNDIKDSRRLP